MELLLKRGPPQRDTTRLMGSQRRSALAQKPKARPHVPPWRPPAAADSWRKRSASMAIMPTCRRTIRPLSRRPTRAARLGNIGNAGGKHACVWFYFCHSFALGAFRVFVACMYVWKYICTGGKQHRPSAFCLLWADPTQFRITTIWYKLPPPWASTSVLKRCDCCLPQVPCPSWLRAACTGSLVIRTGPPHCLC